MASVSRAAGVAMDLNDAGLLMARDGEVIAAGPAVAVLADGELRFGAAAMALAAANPRLVNRRYWQDLSEEPLPLPLGDCRTTADLAQRQLRELWARCAGAGRVVLAVMPGWSPAQLGLLLGMAQESGMPVAGLVDAAVAASRRPYPGRVLWNLEATQHGAVLTRIGQDGGASIAERVFLPRAGVLALERGCADFLARRFVECSRFDPLHDAGSEQRLLQSMPGWLAAARRDERVPLALEHAGNRFEAWFEPAALRAHVARLLEPLAQRMRGLLSPREPAVLEIPARLADYPGLVEALTRLPGCAVVLLEPAAVARGALRCQGAPAGAGALALTTSLPWDQPPETAGVPAATAAVAAPTHVAFAGRAWRLGEEPFHVGTALEEGEYGVRLDPRTEGVSRRHCAIRLESGRAVVHDQSRYGTLLNGHRINGSAVLQAGDVLGVGQPPRELQLLAEVPRGA